jgi:hypothetical protein
MASEARVARSYRDPVSKITAWLLPRFVRRLTNEVRSNKTRASFSSSQSSLLA